MRTEDIEQQPLTRVFSGRASAANGRGVSLPATVTSLEDALGRPKRRMRKSVKKFFSKEKFKTLFFHLSLVSLCCIYVLAGACLFYLLERPLELEYKVEAEELLAEEIRLLLARAYEFRYTAKNFTEFDANFVSAFEAYQDFLFGQFEHPLKSNYHYSLAYNRGVYADMWSFQSAVLFTSTTVIPVGFGQVTPTSATGRIALILYSIVGLPLALMTLSDMGKFLCALLFKCFQNSIPITMLAITLVLLAYPCIGALLIMRTTELNLADSYYFCLQCLFTIGFGDLMPEVTPAYLILFIVAGVMLVTIGIEAIMSGIIHQVHFMGHQMGRAKELAGKMVSALNKIGKERVLSMGLVQMNILARLGTMALPGLEGTINDDFGAVRFIRNMDESIQRANRKAKMSIAYEPKNIHLEFVDHLGS